MPALTPIAAEFTSLMRRLRWTQSGTARQLFITPSHVNQIVNGKAEPSPAMLQLFKLTAAQRHPQLAAQLLAPAAAAPPLSEPDWLDEFWAAVRRRKLDKMPRHEQTEFIRAWAKILGVPFAAK
jgi:transcriptional regulator with XRE-family HTH domain